MVIIYDNVERPLRPPFSFVSIPAAFIGRADGQYLVEHSLGKGVAMKASALLQFDYKDLHSRRVCLPEGEYKFAIYDRFGNGICCGLWGDGNYIVTSNGTVIAKGAGFGSKESTFFSLSFAST